MKTDVEQMSVDSGVSCGASISKLKTEQDRNLMRSVDNLVLCAPPMSTATVEFGGSIPNIPPQHSYHSDLYNTAFTLHTLSSDGGWTDYLSQARSLWDGCLRPEFNGTDRAGSSEKDGVGRRKDGMSSERGQDGGVCNSAPTAAEAVGVGGAKTGRLLFYRHPGLLVAAADGVDAAVVALVGWHSCFCCCFHCCFVGFPCCYFAVASSAALPFFHCLHRPCVPACLPIPTAWLLGSAICLTEVV